MVQKDYTELDIQALNEAVKLSGMPLQSSLPTGGPFGAVIYKDGRQIAAGYNHVLAENDPSAHAEVHTIRQACKALGSWDLSGCVLYSSCEPCPMCLMTSKWANISKIFFAADRYDAEAVGFRDNGLYKMLQPGVWGTQISECRDEAVRIMQEWQRRLGDKAIY